MRARITEIHPADSWHGEGFVGMTGEVKKLYPSSMYKGFYGVQLLNKRLYTFDYCKVEYLSSSGEWLLYEGKVGRWQTGVCSV